MHLSTLASFLPILTALTTATPLTLTPRTTEGQYCKDFTFKNNTHPSHSPLITDCQAMITSVANNTIWHAHYEKNATMHDDEHHYYKKLIEHGTCAFGVHVDYDRHAILGKADVENVITEAIGRFAMNGRIGAKGEMACWKNKDEKIINGVDWNLHRA